jgi:hypothetical protein
MCDDENSTCRMLEPTRLANKYEVDWICTMVGAQLRKRWPTSLAGWYNIAEDEAKKWTRQEVLEYFEEHWDDPTLQLRQLPEPVSSILLARECDVLSILPFAFLHLLRLPIPSDPTDDDFQPMPWAFPERSLLPPGDFHRLALARERIGKWFSRRSDNIWEDCGSSLQCEATILRTWFKIAKDVGRDGNVLQAHRWAPHNLNLGDICPACKDKLEKEIEALRDAFVSQLRTVFQLADDGQ